MNPRPSKLYRPLFALLVGTLLSAGPALGQSSSGADASPSDAFPSDASPPLRPLQVVDSLRAAGDFRTGLTRLYELSRDYPESVEVRWRYAILWSDYGKSVDKNTQAVSAFRKGLKWADRALEADPSSAWAHLSKAAAAGRAALLADGNKESIRLSRLVKDHADRAIELDPTLAPAYHVRGAWHGAVADLGFIQRAVVRAVYGGLPDASFEQAVADLQRSIELESHAYSHLELGQAYLKMGKTEAARNQLQMALDAPLNDPFAPQDKLKARKLLDKLE